MAKDVCQPLAGWRNETLRLPITVVGADLSGKSVRAQVRAAPGTPGAPMIDLPTVTAAGSTGIRLIAVSTTAGIPTTTLELVVTKANMQALPAVGDFGTPTRLAYAFQIEGVTRIWGDFFVLDSPIDSDANAADRSPDGGNPGGTGTSASLNLTIGDDGVTLRIENAEALGALLVSGQKQVDAAAALARAAATASATAVQARDAIVDQISAARVYVTKAEAQADIVNIPADGFATILADETRFKHWTIYRKVGGVLQFVLDRNAGAWVTLEQFGAVADCDPAAATGTPADAALDAAFTALYLAGGGEIRALGRYLFTRAHLLPNTNTQSLIGTQPSIRIVGQGCSMNGGKGNRWIAKTIFFWGGDAGDAVAKIDTRGIGALTISDLDFGSGPNASGKFFFHTTFTALLANRCGFVTDATGPDCVQDAIRFGGTVDFETIPSFDRRSADCGFQGYGSSVTHCYFNGIRIAAHFGRYANSVTFAFNNVWGACGNASGTGAAVTGDGGNTFTVGNNIMCNLFEMHAYRTAIDIDWASAWKIWGNDGYDASDNYTETVVRLGPNCAANIGVYGGLNNPRKPGDVYRNYLDDPYRKAGAFISSYAEESSYLSSLRAGDDQSPNRLGTTRFDAPGAAPVVYQSRQAEVPTAPARMMVRVTFNPLAPSGDDIIDIVMHGGGRQIGGSEAGNVYNWNAANGGASWWEGGKYYGFRRDDPNPARRVGSNLVRDSGTGGSYIFDRGVRIVWEDHNGQPSGYYETTSGEMRIKTALFIGDKQLLGKRLAAIADNKTDSEKIALILAAMRSHGLIET